MWRFWGLKRADQHYTKAKQKTAQPKQEQTRKKQEESRVVIKIEEGFVEVSDKSELTIYERHMNQSSY